ncbi:MAG: hypothetical protein BHW64_00260 [Candidatus Melainabacteria bacterium LEY3_CP_29_8]|nr:MAG: hypothetical protein BHW64_00260 [Candidatus Melainabacteria bacterium LEY3_CP_29_8]
MKKNFFLLFLIFAIFQSSCFGFSLFKKKKQLLHEEEPLKGYYGTLPNLTEQFRELNENKNIEHLYDSKQDLNRDNLLKAPLDNKKYVDIIIKKPKETEFMVDIFDIKNIIEKLKKCIDTTNDIQRFNSLNSNLIDNITYIEKKYKGKVEENYQLYKTLLNLAKESRTLSTLRMEAQTYSKYMMYSGEGAKYKI